MKKYRRVMSNDTEDWSKLWRKTNFLLEKWHEEFGNLNSGKLKIFELKQYCVVASRKMTDGFKNDVICWIFTQVIKVMLDKSSVYNVLAEGMHFLDKCIFGQK